MNKKTFVVVSGYNGSGSSALIDMLIEYDGFFYNGTEMRLICDPYGIKQMERALIDDWDWINASAAIQDYFSFAQRSARGGGGKNPFARSGLNYGKNINGDFIDITKRYLNKISRFKYYGEFYCDKLKMNRLQYSLCRMRTGLEVYSKGKLATANRKKLNNFAVPTKGEFCTATKEYFNELFEELDSKQYPFILLDLALAPHDGMKIYEYFENAKMIVVDRDARDLLYDNIYIGLYRREWAYKNAGKKFVEWQMKMRETLPNDNNILYVNFEDIIYKSGEIRKEVLEFLGLHYKAPDNPRTHLFPEKSAKNIGIWKSVYNEYKGAFDYVTQHMPDYLFADDFEGMEL